MSFEPRKGDWMQTATGGVFWPIDPRPEEVDIQDIAHALSNQCRYAGHTLDFYSVAQHSVLVSENVDPKFALWGLLHDASEAYLSDVIRPVKPSLTNYRALEDRLMRVICERFALPGEGVMPAEVQRVDNAILADEMASLMAFPPKDWRLPQPPLGIEILGWEPAFAKARFLARFRDLTSERA